MREKEYRICKVCGKRFEVKILPDGKPSNAKTCSPHCKGQYSHMEKIPDEKVYRTCVVCGKRFEVKTGARGLLSIAQTCSSHCAAVYGARLTSKRHIKVYRTCVICGKEFEVHRTTDGKLSKAQTCSRSCASLYGKSLKPKKEEKIYYSTCVICGKKFIAPNTREGRRPSKVKTCSKECLKKLMSKNKYDKVPMKKCVVCGKMFKPKLLKCRRYSEATTCSDKCRYALSMPHIYDTKKKNHTFNTSKPEEVIYEMLCTKFSDVKRQYKTKEYPYACDFYVPELKLYIEYQGHWSHGVFKGKALGPYEADNPKHQVALKEMIKRYGKMEVWTVRDPKKRALAKKNGLNWKEFFTLEEFTEWFDSLA